MEFSKNESGLNGFLKDLELFELDVVHHNLCDMALETTVADGL